MRNRTLALSMLIAAMLITAPLASGAIVDATDSGWIRSDNVTSSGGDSENAAGTTSATNAFRTLIQFDGAALPDFTATDAAVTLYGSDNGPDGSGTVQVWLHRVIGSVASGEMNWLQASSSDAWTSPGGDFDPSPLAVLDVDLATFGEDDTLVFQSSDLITAVQDAMDADESLTLMLRTPTLEFSLSDTRNIVWTKGVAADNAPQLNVVPEPATLGLLGLGGLATLVRRRRRD